MPIAKPFLTAVIGAVVCLATSAQTRPTASHTAAVGCAQCHKTESLWQPSNQMGRAMQLRGDNPTLAAHPHLELHLGRYTYLVETHDGATKYIVSDGAQTITLPALWTMGAQAQTWVLERNGVMYESLVSYYPSVNGLDVTTGDEGVHPATLEEAIGRPVGEEDAKACFGCHSTNAVVDHKLNLVSLKPGLTCEHCHTGALDHMASIVHGDDTNLPPDLHTLTSEDMATFCGQCHRTWETVVRSHWTGPTNVRFQPYRLANSRCFDGKDPRIGCTACHNPHEALNHDAAYYDGKCLACHAPAITAADTSNSHAKTCPVATSRCASCHMPKVPLPNGHLIFTDHDIRVVKPGEAYPY